MWIDKDGAPHTTPPDDAAELVGQGLAARVRTASRGELAAAARRLRAVEELLDTQIEYLGPGGTPEQLETVLDTEDERSPLADVVEQTALAVELWWRLDAVEVLQEVLEEAYERRVPVARVSRSLRRTAH